jgi:O-antigen/teichoic acid export membrane protein
MRGIPLLLVSALVPATSELGARNDREKIRRTYYLTTKYVVIVAVAIFSYVILEARSVVNFWIGAGFEESVILIQILAIGYGVNVLGGSASQTAAGVGRLEFDMRSTVILAVLNPILSIWLAHEFGMAGAAAGTSLAMIVSAVYLLVTFHRDYLGDSVSRMIRDIQIRPVVAGVLSNLAVVGFHRLLPSVANLGEVRYLIPLKMAIDFFIFAPVYLVLLIAFRQFTAIDWRNLIGLVTFGFELIRHPFRERVKIYH